MIRRKRYWPDPSENLPIDVMPASNGEFFPPTPTPEQRYVMELANREAERVRAKMGMSRRRFVRTAAAYTVGLWAINQVSGGRWGRYADAHNTLTNEACDLQFPNAQLNNLPGEFIFDVQSHHVDSAGTWRATNPGFEVFFAALWPQAGGVAPGNGPDPYWPTQTPFRGGREVDPIENLSRYHYLKELYLDSATNMTVLSAVPSDPMNNPLPVDQAGLTVATVRQLAGGTERCVMHAFVMPNRGSAGTTTTVLGADPVFMQAEFEQMEQNIQLYWVQDGRKWLRGWKIYTAWGDVPYASGWFLDDAIGDKFCERVADLGDQYGMPKNIAVHKGFALPAFDQRAASARDIGPAARRWHGRGVNFIVYHSGYDGESMGPYPGDDNVNSADRSVNSFIKSLRENGWDATRFIPAGKQHGNVPNVWAEIGSTWRSVMGNANAGAHLIGKLIRYVGPKRICWGTDSLWFGSPQPEIVAFRSLQATQELKNLYNLPHWLEGDVDDPTVQATDPSRTIRNAIFGRNAAVPYQVDPDATVAAISCDDVQAIRDQYLINPLTPDPTQSAPLASNQIQGARTRRELLRDLASKPWSP